MGILGVKATFENSLTLKIFKFGENGVGDQAEHFNVIPRENLETGKVPRTKEHYYYEKGK